MFGHLNSSDKGFGVVLREGHLIFEATEQRIRSCNPGERHWRGLSYLSHRKQKKQNHPLQRAQA